MFVPVFMPHSSPPARCPHCHRYEDKREVCAHCGYKYPEDKYWLSDTIAIVTVGILGLGGGLVLFLLVVTTVINWLDCHPGSVISQPLRGESPYYCETLLGSAQHTLRYIWEMLHRLW